MSGLDKKKQACGRGYAKKAVGQIVSDIILILVISFCAILAFLLFSKECVHAAQITLAWDEQEGAAGYKIYYGTKSDAYTTAIDVGNVTTYPLTLTDGYTYYLAATAYDSSHLESDFSGEIKYEAVRHYYLSVQKSGTGSGRVSSMPSTIDCGSTCIADYKKGAKVALTPIPNSGSVFTGWAGDCAGVGTCSVTMSTDRTAVAVFETGSCTYTISSNSKTLNYTGGTITIGVASKDHAICAAPDNIVNDTNWITYTASAFTKNRGSIRLFVSEHGSSTGRSATLTIAGNTFAVTQKGRPCSVTLSSSSSSLFPESGGSGSFNVIVTPSDCAWSAAPTSTSGWIHATPGSGKVDYTVDENTGKSARTGRIVVTLSSKSKSYTVKQANR